jgi:lipoprotein-anchoring transpeptidase ErfK/SrfK
MRIRRIVYAVMMFALALGMVAAFGGPAQAAPKRQPAASVLGSSLSGEIAGTSNVDIVSEDIAPALEMVSETELAVAKRTGKWIEVVLSEQRLNAWQNGQIVMSSAVSSGVRRTPTRRGTFRVYVKYRATRMRGPGYNLPAVPYTMYYSGDYAIHGAYWHNNFGRPMSHGCVNLPVAFARRLYSWAPKGTVVVIR